MLGLLFTSQGALASPVQSGERKGGTSEKEASVKDSAAAESARRIVRICTYDLASYEQAASEPIPKEVDNTRTRTAQNNQRSLITKVRDICESRPYWLRKLIDWGNGATPDVEDESVSGQVAYTLELQVRYLREAKKTYVRVVEEESDRQNRSGQLQEIFGIRNRLRRAQKEAAGDAMMKAASEAVAQEELLAAETSSSSEPSEADAPYAEQIENPGADVSSNPQEDVIASDATKNSAKEGQATSLRTGAEARNNGREYELVYSKDPA